MDTCIWVSEDKPEAKLNFHDANAMCAQMTTNGRLFEPMNKLQHRLVHQLAEESRGPTPSNGIARFLIGTTDKEEEGK